MIENRRTVGAWELVEVLSYLKDQGSLNSLCFRLCLRGTHRRTGIRLPLQMNYLPNLPFPSHTVPLSHRKSFSDLKSPTYSILEGKPQSCKTTESAFPTKPATHYIFPKMCTHVLFLLKRWISFPDNLFPYVKTIFLMDTQAPNTLTLVLSHVTEMVSNTYKVCPQIPSFHGK